MTTPLVSVCCITYNHASFIRKCLDGFLMQQTDFPIEILIHDDCSTDGTTEIIQEYAAQYPDLIFPMYEEVNQYQQGKATEIDFYNYRRARGKYIAYCEGDDYWTDPLKIQKQVDFMETNPEYSVCFHGFEEYYTKIDKWRSIELCKGKDVELTSNVYLRNSCWGQPLTMLFRSSMFDFAWCNKYRYYRDTHEIYHLLQKGKGYFLNFKGGVYNRHDGGIATSMSYHKSNTMACDIFMELYRENGNDKDLRNLLIDTLIWKYKINKKSVFYKLCVTYLFLAPSVILQTLWIILKRKFKSMNS